jgi:hypothetical protein
MQGQEESFNFLSTFSYWAERIGSKVGYENLWNAISSASIRTRFPISSQSMSVRSLGGCLRCVKSRINLESIVNEQNPLIPHSLSSRFAPL